MNDLKKLEPFRYWVQKTLPIVYDDSLSYYELLGKVTYHLNETMETQNQTSENFGQLVKRFNELNEYVNNYFDNLDVQDEINDKLDKLVADGTMDTIINHNIFNDLTQQLAQTEKVVNVKSMGAKGDGVADDTQAFIDAIAYAKTNNISKVIVPDGVYMLAVHDDSWNGNHMLYGVIELENNMIFEMSKDAFLKVIPNSMGSYNVLSVIGKENVGIRGGNIIGDRYAHTGTTGEWGYGIALVGAKNVLIEDVNISDCWGDGINLQFTQSIGNCENINIDNVVCDNNRRQGMSIESAINVRVSNSRFLNTNGIAPQSGIDIEPALTTADCTNIVIDKCEFKGNKGHHILINNNRKDVKIVNCDFGDNSNESINVNKSVKGVLINGNTFVKKGITLYKHTDGEYGDALISNNVFKELNKAISLNRGSKFINNVVEGAAIFLSEPKTDVINNHISNTTVAIFAYDGDFSDLKVIGNTFKNVETALKIDSSITSENVFFNNNNVDHSKDGVNLKGLKSSVIKGNSFITKRIATDGIFYGIHMVSKNSDITIENNSMQVEGINKFKKAIYATNFSENSRFHVNFNSVKGTTTTVSNEIELAGVNSNLYNITTE